MKQLDDGAVLRRRRNVTSLGSIAGHTSKRQIRFVGQPAVLFADDVIHLAAKVGVRLGDPAVLTTSVGTDENKPAQFRRDISPAHAPSRPRARALAILMRCSSLR